MIFSILSQLSTVLASDLALYWGQASAGSQQSLGSYCENSPGDIYIISFINSFGSGNQLSVNVAGYNNYFSGTSLLNAPEIGADIEKCQAMGKKVLISLGGAAGSYGFNSANDAESVAQQVWDHFAGGSSDKRPFGAAKVDGFDLDGENNLNAANYVPFVNKLRQLYASDSSKQYYVSAAPQCPYPDATNGEAIAHADIDFLFVQFYNNYCSLTGNNFNFDTWQNFASNSSPNKNVKLYVGLPGSPSAAGSGYATIDQVKAKLPELKSQANFAGFMVWDASQANSNIVNGVSFAQQLKNLDGGSTPQPTVKPTTSSAPATSSSSSSAALESPVSSTTSSAAWVASVTSSAQNGNAVTSPEHTALVSSTISAFGVNTDATHILFPTAFKNMSAVTASPVDVTTTVHTTDIVVDSTSCNTRTITSEPSALAAVATSEPNAPVPTTSGEANAAVPTITSKPTVSTATSTGSASQFISNGVVIVYETVWETEYTTKWNCETKTVTSSA